MSTKARKLMRGAGTVASWIGSQMAAEKIGDVTYAAMQRRKKRKEARKPPSTTPTPPSAAYEGLGESLAARALAMDEAAGALFRGLTRRLTVRGGKQALRGVGSAFKRGAGRVSGVGRRFGDELALSTAVDVAVGGPKQRQKMKQWEKEKAAREAKRKKASGVSEAVQLAAIGARALPLLTRLKGIGAGAARAGRVLGRGAKTGAKAFRGTRAAGGGVGTALGRGGKATSKFVRRASPKLHKTGKFIGREAGMTAAISGAMGAAGMAGRRRRNGED